jgi:hypothetical protein
MQHRFFLLFLLFDFLCMGKREKFLQFKSGIALVSELLRQGKSECVTTWIPQHHSIVKKENLMIFFKFHLKLTSNLKLELVRSTAKHKE